jgi:ornithine carbamoyltransferase
MAVCMKGKDVLSLRELTTEEVWQVIKTAEMIKLMHKSGQPYRPLAGKTLAMIFAKPSTRTRISFEVAMYQLGGHALNLSGSELQLKRGESIADTGRVLAGYLDGIMIRTFSHQDVVDLAEAATIPVLNGLTDLHHPCQVLSDLLTIYEKKGRVTGLHLVYVGDGNNVAHSLMLGGAKVGLHVTICCPEGYDPDPAVVRDATADAVATGARIQVVRDAAAAVREADIVYTDVWASMGQEAEHDKRVKLFQPYQVNGRLMAAAKKDAIFMHCLPAHRGEEVTDEVADAPYSVIFHQAENRLHAQKAILALVM